MKNNVVMETQDLTYLKWSHIRSSSGTAGTFLKSESEIAGKKSYYKLSNFDSVNGVIGHECINEIIVDRLLTLLGVEHLSYELIKGAGDVFSNKLKESDRGIIFEGLETLLSDVFMDKIWNMIYERYKIYENL